MTPSAAVGRAESGRPDTRGATRVVVAVLGTLVGLTGVQHGVGEILQGPGRPGGLLIEAWPGVAALEIVSGEPAMTVVPDLLVTGVLAVAVGLLVAAWSVGFVHHRPGGLVLIGLSVLLLLAGGGIASPLLGVTLGAMTHRVHTVPNHTPRRFTRGLGRLWPWFLAAAVAGQLAFVPGLLVAHPLGIASEPLVGGLAVFAYANLGLALVAAWSHDRALAGLKGSRS